MAWIRLIRTAFVALVLIISGFSAHAQTWSEWFSQKKTQQKYLVEQLAALKLYAGYLKKGYEIGSSGLTFIKGAAKGEFDMHGTFFSSLKAVSPLVSKDVRIAEIIKMQILISQAFSALHSVDGLSAVSSRYVEMVKQNLSSECMTDLEELLLILTAERLEMGDEERIIRIDRLYQSMQTKKSFALRFVGTARSLANEKNHELKSLEEMEVWYENR
ncbi:hypothetical protein EA772_01590 [Pedobacter sp. G11]|uniref:hypothetical protein n=1 Tax=Pedobacter sp. G11 TaxID=2482728 RepID=UPI000F5F9518|nr:hypothetical protein [Pedobacter sp. G11]AZI24098.1 hypothetical protein EA772_01590 [Pedobacter sp. G11]